MALGYYKSDCSGCEGRFAADVAGSSGKLGFGIRLSENQYTLGLLFGVADRHRFGVVLGTDNSAGTGNKMWFGIGFGGKSWHFVGYSDYVKDIALVASFYF